MTGAELGALREIGYDTRMAQRQSDVADNLAYFLAELVALPRVAELLRERLHGRSAD